MCHAENESIKGRRAHPKQRPELSTLPTGEQEGGRVCHHLKKRVGASYQKQLGGSLSRLQVCARRLQQCYGNSNSSRTINLAVFIYFIITKFRNRFIDLFYVRRC